VSVSSRLCEMARNMVSFYGEGLASSPTPKLEDQPLSDVCDWLFDIFAATGGRSSICNQRTRHAIVLDCLRT
jgi:hypothetical protein